MRNPSKVAGQAGAPRLTDILHRAGIDKHSVIQVTGPDAFSALLWFCRHGYETAGYTRCGAPHPAEPVDALVVPHACGADELLMLLDGAPRVHPGGALVFHSAANADEDAITSVLGRFDYHLLARYPHGVCVARRGAPLVFAKAA